MSVQGFVMSPALSASNRHKLLTATNPIGSDFQKGVTEILVKVVKSDGIDIALVDMARQIIRYWITTITER
jgi:hypothetical protein